MPSEVQNMSSFFFFFFLIPRKTEDVYGVSSAGRGKKKPSETKGFRPIGPVVRRGRRGGGGLRIRIP